MVSFIAVCLCVLLDADYRIRATSCLNQNIHTLWMLQGVWTNHSFFMHKCVEDLDLNGFFLV